MSAGGHTLPKEVCLLFFDAIFTILAFNCKQIVSLIEEPSGSVIACDGSTIGIWNNRFISNRKKIMSSHKSVPFFFKEEKSNNFMLGNLLCSSSTVTITTWM